MKSFLSLALLATSTISFAAERNIYDIMYLPESGTTYGATLLSIGRAKQEANGSDTKVSGYSFYQFLGHSFTDRLAIQFFFDYSDTEVDPEGEKKYDSTTGFSDPSFSARYRIQDEAILWDFAAGATLSLGDKETEVNSEDRPESDNRQGGNSLFFGTQLGSKTDHFQWALAAQVTHNFKSETEYKFENGLEVTLEDDAHNELTLQADILNKLAEKSFFKSHMTANFTESYEDDRDNKSASSTSYDIGTEYQHLLSQDLLLRIGIDYTILKIRTGQIDKLTAWTYNFGLNYQF